MDIFEHQDRARAKSRWLVFSFLLATLGVIACNYLLIMAFTQEKSWWDLHLFLTISLFTGLVLFAGTCWKALQLREGGSAVAEELGGRRIDAETTNPNEKRLIHVVEEMAIASGVPVPQVYLLEREEAINAFAAGRNPSDAVVAVSRGSLQQLTRDELQGVVAHEFSHILNGDMRLNLRMISLLHGILMVALLGQLALRIGLEMRTNWARNEDDRKAEASLRFFVILIGAGIMAIGYAGIFFGNLIKFAFSRQREYLADASAVQFTRNPDGLGGALKKIAQTGSRIKNAKASEASHLFFADGVGASWFQTHPDIADRIQRLDPSWRKPDGEAFTPEKPSNISIPLADRHEGISHFASAVSVVHGEQLQNSQEMLPNLREKWSAEVYNPLGAQAALYALILTQEDQLHPDENRALRSFDQEFRTVITNCCVEAKKLNFTQRLALAEMAIPALKRLSYEEYENFVNQLRILIHADAEVSLFEFALERLVERHLEFHFCRRSMPKVRFTRVEPLRQEIMLLLASLAEAGTNNRPDAEKAFAQGMSRLLPGPYLWPEHARHGSSEAQFKALDLALRRLDESSPLLKRKILRACVQLVEQDGKVLDPEMGLLRAFAEGMGCAIGMVEPA
jgi:Zn-dependent protease with chaperone function